MIEKILTEFTHRSTITQFIPESLLEGTDVKLSGTRGSDAQRVTVSVITIYHAD